MYQNEAGLRPPRACRWRTFLIPRRAPAWRQLWAKHTRQSSQLFSLMEINSEYYVNSFHLLTKEKHRLATKWWTNNKPRCSKYAASPSPLAFLSLRKMQCSSLIWAPLKTISCRLSASAWPTLKQQRPFWEGEHHSYILAAISSQWPKIKGTFGTTTFSRQYFSTLQSFVSDTTIYYCAPGAQL